jgi:hypothetical protein
MGNRPAPSWTCQRCYRIWSPFTPGCPVCNDPAQIKIWLVEEAERQIRHFEAMAKARRMLFERENP